MSKVAQLSFALRGSSILLWFMGQILCWTAQSAPLRVYRSGKCVFPKVTEAERSSKERLTEGGGDSRPMSGVFSQRGFWKFAFWLLGKEDTHGNGGTCHTSPGKVSDSDMGQSTAPPELLQQISLPQSFSYRPCGSPSSVTKSVLKLREITLSLHSYSEQPTLNRIEWIKNRFVRKICLSTESELPSCRIGDKVRTKSKGKNKTMCSPRDGPQKGVREPSGFGTSRESS